MYIRQVAMWAKPNIPKMAIEILAGTRNASPSGWSKSGVGNKEIKRRALCNISSTRGVHRQFSSVLAARKVQIHI